MFGIAMLELDGRRTAALVQGEEVLDLSRALPRESAGSGLLGNDTLELLRNWPAALPALERLAAAPRRGDYRVPRAQARWLPPVCYPDKLLCAGANYTDHAKEMGSRPQDAATDHPFFFLKSARNTLIGDGEAIVLPPASQKVDWEVEVAVVIGRRAKHVPAAAAMDYVAGYTVFNDISARDLNRRTDVPFPHDWVGGKCADTFGPLGPAIVPSQFVSDWRRLHLRLRVNGALKQDAPAALMIHSIPAQIAFLSRTITLEPGDIIATGTPAGVGAGRQEFLKPGDVVVSEIEGIGRLTNRCVAE